MSFSLIKRKTFKQHKYFSLLIFKKRSLLELDRNACIASFPVDSVRLTTSYCG